MVAEKSKYIVVSGIDGAGKTTVIECLRKQLELKGLKAQYYWLRYNHILVKPVHAFCRLVGLSKCRDSLHGNVWRHEFYKSQAFCSFYIFITWIDTWIGRWKLEYNLRGENPDVVICDRWTSDILVDLAVDTRRADLLEMCWYDRFLQIEPRSARQFLVVRNMEAILECRPEYRDDPEFEFRENMYCKLEKIQDGMTVIDNNRSVEQSANEILYKTIKDKNISV